MNTNRLESAIRGLLLCAVLLVSNLAQAQWDYAQIETLSDEAQQLKQQGMFASAYELYPQIMFQLRVHEGLYSEKQVPLLLELAGWHIQQNAQEEVEVLLQRAEFYASRAENPLPHYRKVAAQRLYLPNQRHCFVRDEEGLLDQNKDCFAQRYFRADAFIAATELMVKVVAISDDRQTDLTDLADLATYTAISVFDAYEVVVPKPRNSVYEVDHSIVFSNDPFDRREEYRFQKWQKLNRRTLSTLAQEFDMGRVLSSL